MLNRLWSFLTGYLILIVEGKNLEKLINMAISRGLYVWDVRWIDEQRAKVKVRLNGVNALRHIARRSQNRFKIVGKGGLPFKIAKIKKRKMLTAGAVLSLAVVYMLSSFIWFVEVRGNKKLPDQKIVQIAAEAGLGMGTVKLGLDKDMVEKYIRNEIPELSWVGVKIEGTRAIIEVAEKTIIVPEDTSIANIVAKKDGLIKELLVLAGKGMVQEGATVKKGDLLISGTIMPDMPSTDVTQQEQEQEQKSVGETKYVRARGLVRAQVWYDGYGECKLRNEGVKRSGKTSQVTGIRIFGKELVLKGSQKVPFRNYEEITDAKSLPIWRNIHLPVEFVTTNYYEVVRYRDIISVSDAKNIAVKQALEDAKGQLPQGAKIAGEITEELPGDPNLIRVKVIVEAIEDIGQVQTFKP